MIGTTGVLSTPLTSSAAMADALEDGDSSPSRPISTTYHSGECINEIVHQYLIWLEVPDAGTRCS